MGRLYLGQARVAAVILRLLIVAASLSVGAMLIRGVLHAAGLRRSDRLGNLSDRHHGAAMALGLAREGVEVADSLGPKGRLAMRTFQFVWATFVVLIIAVTMVGIVAAALFT